MRMPILKTKLNIPVKRTETVDRVGILRGIKDAEYQKLILISAPAGFGKTTTACQIIEKKNLPVAWFSLDKNDNEVKRFLTYFIEAVRTLKKEFLPEAEQLMISFNSIGKDYLLHTLINEILTVSERFLFVLDDFHLIENSDILFFMKGLLENMPSNMQIIITTREDPDFPLSKMRAKNELYEIRADVLRFDIKESSFFFSDVMGLNLEDTELKSLETQTEGWIAGLQLSAVSLKNHVDKNRFIENFSENHYYIMDYLLEEVLETVDEAIKIFLLKTSVFETLCGSLCDEILDVERGYSQKILEKLCNSNVFLFELDKKRQWFRYHHLFSELLRQKYDLSVENNPSLQADKRTIHRRACIWYRKNHYPYEAVRHAYLAEDFNLAAEIVELEWAKMDMTLQTDSWLEMLKLIPDEMIQKRPVLNTGYVWAKLDIGDFDGIEERLRRSERLYEKMKERQEKKESDMVQVSDYEQFENLPATIASAWAYYYAAIGDEKKTGEYAEKALEVHHGMNYHRRGIINIMFGFSLWRSGDLKGAYKKIGEATQDFKRVDEKYSELSVQVVNAEILLELGKLNAAEELCLDSLKKTKGHKLLEMLNASFYLTLCHLSFIKKDKGKAEEYLRKSVEWGKDSALPDWKHNWYTMKSLIETDRGDYVEALNSLKYAEEIYFPNPMPDIWDIRELKIKNYILKGDIGSAEMLAEDREALKGYIERYSEGTSPSNENNNQLIEPLTKRELEILSLISEGLSNKDISERLYLALSTVKGYNQNIFSKLQVKSRGMAVNKARELGII